MSATRRMIFMLVALGVAIVLASGVALADIINGTNGDDTITGTAGGDLIDGRDGNDTISGLAGADDVVGGLGDDALYGGDLNTDIADDGGSNIEGGGGNDDIVGSSGADILEGGPGADNLLEGPENDAAEEEMYGGDGDDTLNAVSTPAYKDVVSCGAGVDKAHVDRLDVVASDCELVGMSINGTEGNDTIDGFNGDDMIYGRAGSDLIQGGAGGDQIWGTNEQLSTMEGREEIYGEAGTDTIFGGSDADKLDGGVGNDTINDGPPDDAAVDNVVGGDGDDEIDVVNDSSAARDVVNCGSGTDTVEADKLDEVSANCENVERDTEFEPVDLSGTDFQTREFNCWGRNDDPHKSSEYHEVAAKAKTECLRNQDKVWVKSELYRYRFFGWRYLDTRTAWDYFWHETPVIRTHWDCWYQHRLTYRQYSGHLAKNGGNYWRDSKVNTSNTKIWC